MSLVSLPSGLFVADFSLRLNSVSAAFSSPFGGSEQVVDLLSDRWVATLSIVPTATADSGAIEAFIAAMRGGVNHVELYHFARQRPLGTLTGSVTAQTTAKGASSIVLNATTGQTLKAGDLFGVDGLLLQAAADCTAVSSAITVPIVNRLRRAITAGEAVTLVKPKVPMRMIGGGGITHRTGYAEGVTLDFVEKVDA